MVQKIPRWESELWSYLSASDGMRCPLYEHCHVRLIGKWCLDDERERLDQLLDSGRYRLNDLRFIESECGTCGGKRTIWRKRGGGWQGGKCPVCARHPGKAKCPVCGGSGWAGVCPTCKGNKQITCAECNGTGKKPAAVSASAQMPIASN